jgi:hypothetical protein
MAIETSTATLTFTRLATDSGWSALRRKGLSLSLIAWPLRSALFNKHNWSIVDESLIGFRLRSTSLRSTLSLRRSRSSLETTASLSGKSFCGARGGAKYRNAPGRFRGSSFSGATIWRPRVPPNACRSEPWRLGRNISNLKSSRPLIELRNVVTSY